jgi:hypothetical protein
MPADESFNASGQVVLLWTAGSPMVRAPFDLKGADSTGQSPNFNQTLVILVVRPGACRS